MKAPVRPLFLAVAAVLTLAGCGTPTADAPADDVFGGDLGFTTKFDVISTDLGQGKDAIPDVPPAGDAFSDAAKEIVDATADAADGDVPVNPDALVSDSDDATATVGDAAVDGTDDAAIDAAGDATVPVDDGPPALCRPCAQDSECQALNPAAVCIAYGTTGSFCGSGCTANSDCPKGYICADAEGTSGPAGGKQCLHVSGECPCSAQATADGASTPCVAKNGVGTCQGKRTCLAGGLSACDAPAAVAEACNGMDDNCNGLTDELGATGCTSFYGDNDGDGIGAGAATCLCSNVGTSLAAGNTDCDDNNYAVYPGAPEICNDVDDNCNGVTDEGCDADGDGWCNQAASVVGTPKVCKFGGGDCNDSSAAIHPGQPDTCGNGVDDNCDGETDVAVGGPGCTAFYVDGDGDGYGAGVSQCSCGPTGAYTAAAGGDCDDGDASVHPKAQEICSNGKDDDCNGKQDEGAAVGCSSWYLDGDKDGYGAGAAACLCVSDANHTANKAGDCNDASAGIHPGAPEKCNNADDNCNGQTDEGPPVDCTTFYADGDKDGYGGDVAACLCAADAAHPVSIGGDCNDASSAIHPGATETCNTLDDNCNGQTDELGAKGCSSFHVDADLDGYGGQDVKCACAADPVYHTLDATDCDDTHASVHPGAPEICDGLDNNCDGVTDPAGLDTCSNFFYDGDTDGYGTTQALIKCMCAASGLWSSSVPGDCNDADSAIHPGATETCNGKDDNCDGSIDNGAGTVYFADGDGDTYGNPLVSLQSCSPVPTFVTNSLDCNDGKPLIHPGATEICDGVDNDCNGQTDEGLCDDANPCTVDACVPGSGCTHTVSTAACDDGSACTTGDSCATGTCKGTAVNCDDGNVCTTDACAAASGCSHGNNALACDDGNPCTGPDACSAGACKGAASSCDDSNVCTADACVPASGCTHTQICAGLPFADAGNTYAEGLNASGSLLAWGNAAAPPTGTYVQVSAGYSFACVVTAAGSMKCWGASTPSGLSTTQTGVKQVSVGNPQACVIKSDDTLKCWSTDTLQTTNVPTGAFSQVSCGYDHSCALRADGSVACWGGTTYKQTTVPAGETFSQISAGDFFTCGIRKSGSGIVCWGDNSSYAVSAAPNTGSFLSVGAGTSACAIRSDNTLTCWTTTGFGASTPPANTKWLSIGVGENNVCGVLTDKTVKCFGDNTNKVVTGVPTTGW